MGARSVPGDPFLDVVGALAGTELDDARLGKSVLDKRIFRDDGSDLLSVPADRQDDPAISRHLAARDQEIAGGVVLSSGTDVRGHARVDLGEVGLVDQFDDEHGRSTCTNRTALGEDI